MEWFYRELILCEIRGKSWGRDIVSIPRNSRLPLARQIPGTGKGRGGGGEKCPSSAATTEMFILVESPIHNIPHTHTRHSWRDIHLYCLIGENILHDELYRVYFDKFTMILPTYFATINRACDWHIWKSPGNTTLFDTRYTIIAHMQTIFSLGNLINIQFIRCYFKL